TTLVAHPPPAPAAGRDLIPLATMPPTEEQVRRKARVLAAFMSSQEATVFAHSFALDPDRFINEWAERSNARARLPKGYQPPRVADISDSAAAHVAEVQAHPKFSAIYGSSTPTFKSIELGRLIASQYWWIPMSPTVCTGLVMHPCPQKMNSSRS